MTTSRLLGALCTLSLSALAPAQFVDGSMTVWIAANWTMGACYYVPATHDPLGLILPNGAGLVNTVATSDGDHCEADGIARDAVAGGNRLTQTATAEGLHFCEWFYVPTPEEPLGEVEIAQGADIYGTVTLTNQNCAGAGLGWVEATSNVLPVTLAVLDDSAAETVVGGLGDVSAAYTGISGYSANVQFGNGTFADSDSDSNNTVICINYVYMQHRSRAYVKVAALRSVGSPGTTEADASMYGDAWTGALLYVCPHD